MRNLFQVSESATSIATWSAKCSTHYLCQHRSFIIHPTAIHGMKSNRAPGVDRISAEMLKADPVVSAQPLHLLFCNIRETATFHADWMDLTDGASCCCVSFSKFYTKWSLTQYRRILTQLSEDSKQDFVPDDPVWTIFPRSVLFWSKSEIWRVSQPGCSLIKKASMEFRQ